MQTFKKEMSNGTIYLTSEKRNKFINAANALLAMQAAQFVMVMSDYLTTSHINITNGIIELSVHFEGKPFPKLPNGYGYTWSETTSHYYWNDYSKEVRRCRVKRLVFEFENEK